MTIRNFINNRRGISTVGDNVNSITPSNLEGQFYIETDTGRIHVSNGITTTQFTGPDATGSFIGKILDPELNTIDSSQIEDFPFNNSVYVKGGIIPAATITDSFYGILENAVTLSNANKPIIVNSTSGIYNEFKSATTNAAMGFTSTSQIARRSKNYYLEGDFSAASSRMFVGFSSNNTIPDPDGFGLATSDHGILVGFNGTNNAFQLFSNDGSTGPISMTFPTVAKDTLLHNIKISMSSANITCSVDGNSVVVSTNLPGINTDLYTIVFGIY